MKEVKVDVDSVMIDTDIRGNMPGVYVNIGSGIIPYALFKNDGSRVIPLTREEEEIEKWLGENLREDLRDVRIFIHTSFSRSDVTMREKKINDFIKSKILEVNEKAVVTYKENNV